MTHTPLRPLLSRLVGIALLCCAGLAQAQFVWIAPNGTRQYSDQPPPPGTPPSKILKAPGRSAMSAGEPAGIPPAQVPPVAKPKGMTLAEREADYRKRAQERVEAEGKARDEAKRLTAQREYCNEMRNSKRMYEAGARVAAVGSDGKQRFLDDSERAERAAAIDKALADCR
ncbi:DUF4124 domain-containing protein [Massilia niabensis]|uniref:DUF4124 domain-containing protein n=1 Tax=Massilia niabensis TaxID=544910 RepID=A0ABW0L807_9BURK